MSDGGWNVNQGSSTHSHTKLENELEINNQLIINSASDNGQSFIYRDHRRLWFLVDRDEDGNYEEPHPLFLDHQLNAARIFGDLVWTENNLPIESGTWSPQLRSSANDFEPTYHRRTGIYKRIGSLVYIAFNFSTSSIIGGRGGNLQIHGLPYPSGDLGIETYVKFPVAQQFGFSISSGYQLSILLSQNQSFLSLWENDQHGDIKALTIFDLEASSLISTGGCYAI
ncbi:MAG: hypothetical protein AAFO04_29510 [Cyanobacteria bacterium J06592_8]